MCNLISFLFLKEATFSVVFEGLKTLQQIFEKNFKNRTEMETRIQLLHITYILTWGTIFHFLADDSTNPKPSTSLVNSAPLLLPPTLSEAKKSMKIKVQTEPPQKQQQDLPLKVVPATDDVSAVVI